MHNLSLYIHIPFCVKKCHYCDFLSAPCKEETKQEYVEALCREISQQAKEFKNKKVDTIFFGGGTPSLLSAEQITQIMSTVKKEFHILQEAEISMEMNPGTVEQKKLEVYKKLGINRLSIGLQSANNQELKTLGRIHTWEDFLKTWKMVREAGFTNVNIDLMSALPGQTLESYEETLRKILELKPEHISAYSLIIEEGTLFYEWYGEESEGEIKLQNPEEKCGAEIGKKTGENRLPDEITDRKMYELTKELLEERGYYRYEISNYALSGYECKHNIGYWKRKEYLGLGLGAASLIWEEPTNKCEDRKFQNEEKGKSSIKNVRCSNITDLEKYLSMETAMVEEIIELSTKEQMEEFMFLGLRMMEGVSPGEFKRQFGQDLKNVYGKQIEKLEKQSLLEFRKESGRYALTAKGIDVSNQVFVEFI